MSRSPLGLRGLKCVDESGVLDEAESQPTRAAWIEIGIANIRDGDLKSQPTRAAWIEIKTLYHMFSLLLVAAHSGCVD